jgi:hypothetical protein
VTAVAQPTNPDDDVNLQTFAAEQVKEVEERQYMNEKQAGYDVSLPLVTETLSGSNRPINYFLAPTMDGLYTRHMR